MSRFRAPLPRAFLLASTLAASTLVACSSPVASGLDDSDANEVRVALDRAGISATRELDPGAEGKFRIIVPDDDAAQAAAVLKEEMLPRERPKGVLEALGQGSLVPSGQTEHAQYARGVAGELERSLGGVEGILRARVHLQLPTTDPLHLQAPLKGSASVLLEHRGDQPPISAESVQKLVAGGAPGVSDKDVAVVFVAHRMHSTATSMNDKFARVGPFAVSRGAQRPLQALLGALFLAVVGLAGACLALYLRSVRLRQAQPTQGATSS